MEKKHLGIYWNRLEKWMCRKYLKKNINDQFKFNFFLVDLFMQFNLKVLFIIIEAAIKLLIESIFQKKNDISTFIFQIFLKLL